MKKIIKIIFNKVKRCLKFKEAIYIPVFQGELLKGRIALITGGGKGIGYYIAKCFYDNGASVIITGRDESVLAKAVETIKNDSKHHGYIEYNVLDITSDNVEMELNKICENKRIDILVNNAGIGIGETIGNTKKTDFDNVYNTNIKGMYFISQYFYNYYKNNHIHGNILNVLSSSSLRPATTPYSISKWGMHGFTIGLAKKAIEYGIIVNGIAPGPTIGGMIKNADDDLTLTTSPIKRYATPQEIANGALFLVSDMGKTIVGDVIYMTGGAGIITVDDIIY